MQLHDVRRQLFELFLEVDGVLNAWSIAQGPSTDPRSRRLAVRNGERPLEAAEFEGQLPDGDGVLVWDRGFWRSDAESAAGALAAGSLRFELQGTRLHGGWSLTRLKADGRRESWVLVKERDEWAGDSDDLGERFDTSVVSGRSLLDITRGRKPGAASDGRLPFVPPMLCTAVDSVADAPSWIYEVEYDGYRLQLCKDGSAVALRARNGADWHDRFPAIAAAAAGLADGALILDGEVIAMDPRGACDFATLSGLLDQGPTDRAVFMAFDVLMIGGVDLRPRPLIARKGILTKLLATLDPGGPIRLAPCVPAAGSRLLERVARSGCEGIVAKDATAPYEPGPSSSWQKVTLTPRADAAIVGFVPAAAPRFVGSLLVAEPRADHLAFRGQVAANLSGPAAERLAATLDAMQLPDPPSRLDPRPPNRPKSVRWIEPRLTAAVRHKGLTRTGAFRAPQFLGLRYDRDPVE